MALAGVAKDDWQRFKAAVQTIASGEHRTAEIAAELVADYRRMEAAGDSQAETFLNAIAQVGMETAAKQALKEDTGSIAIGSNGSARIVTVPTYYGVRRRDPETGELFKQSEMWQWVVLPWSEFENLIRILSRQAQIIADRALGLKELLALREQFPESKTPLEACELAGINPLSFELAQ